MKPAEFKARVAVAFDELLPLCETISTQSRFLDDEVLPYVPKGCMRAIDLGCGYAELTTKLAARCEEVTGYDISHRMIEEGRKRQAGSEWENVELVQGDCESLIRDFRDVDYVVCVRSIHYFDIPPLLNLLRETAKPGTRAIIVGISRKFHRDPVLNLLLESLFYVVHPWVVWRFISRFGFKLFIEIHRLKYLLDRSPLWNKHIDSLIFGGMLTTYQEYARLYQYLLPGCSIERITVREFIVKWERAESTDGGEGSR